MSDTTGPSALQEAMKGGTSGYHRRMQSNAHRARVLAVGKLFGQAIHGDRYSAQEFNQLMGGRPARMSVNEVMSTSDFPLLFGDFLNRSLAVRYQLAPTVWPQFAARQTVRDFRPSKIIDFFGAGGVLSAVPQLSPYPERAFSESEFETTLGKYGDRLAWAWENQINDDLGAFSRAPAALATGARFTEDYLATSVLVGAGGVNSGFYASPDNKPLTAANLEAAYQEIANVVDGDGNPIDIGVPVLLVPMGLALTANNIIHTTEFRPQTGSGAGQVTSIVAGNGLSVTPTVVVNRWLTAINKAGTAATTWFLLPDPNGPRPAVYETFLQGYETPDIRVKADAGMALGGGQIDPAEGSFERDDVQYRIRHVAGGNQGFTDAVYASNGA